MKNLLYTLIIIATLTSCGTSPKGQSIEEVQTEARSLCNIPNEQIETIMRADSAVKWGCAAVMDVNTGRTRLSGRVRDSLGMPSRYGGGIVIDSLLEVGGAFRTATLLALLDNGDAELDDIFDYQDSRVMVGSAVCSDSSISGEVSLRNAFLLDSDPAFAMGSYKAYFGEGGDSGKFYTSIENMGFAVENRPPTQLAAINSYGYGIVAKPAQTLQLFSAIANGGRLLDIKYFLDDTTKVINPQIASKRAIKKVQQLLVERGDKSGFDNVAFTMGTTFNRNADGERIYYTTVAGYFPADAPRYAAIVSIDNDGVVNNYALNIFAELVREMKASHYLLSSTMWNGDCICCLED
ncbi:MAG: penicillin-binding transpeptidase domain-containing protein [Rikenellaceae bacterium]